MRFHVRISILTFVVAALVAALAPTAAQAAFGVESFFAANCNAFSKGECKLAGNPAEEKEKAEEEGFTQAGGHPNFGVTDFTVNNFPVGGQKVPEGIIRHIRVDVAPGVSTNPQAVPKCSLKDFGEAGTAAEVAPGTFAPSTCPTSTEIGENKVTVVVAGPTDVPLEGTVYNLEQTKGLSSLFGVALSLENIGFPGLFAHTLIEGGVEYATDYHDFFEIKVSETLPLLSSRLVFKGNIGTGGFLTNPTSCTGIGPQTTTKVMLEDNKGETGSKSYTTPIGDSGCELVPFAPLFSLEPETKTSDKPDGITAELSVPHNPNHEEIDSSDLKTATLKLPEGVTMNPSAAAGLEGCTPEQIGIGTRNATKCPLSSRIGTVSLEVPGLPAESLKGYVYLGKPASGPITGPPYTIYVDAESEFYNVKVRVKGTVEPNSTTGQLTTTFNENPEQPFSDVIMHFNGGAFAPLANPLKCETGTTKLELGPFAGSGTLTKELAFPTENCSSPQFAPTQTTSVIPPAGGSDTGFAFNLTRPEGQQYVEKLTTTLPEGLVGKIPTVTQCTEAQASVTQESGAGCPEGSWIGTVRVTAGSGEPYPFTGNVYLTGPYQGAPYGLAIKVPTVAGPFNLGEEITRAKISVEPFSARVVVSSTLPTIKGGIPIRMRSLSVDVSRPNYILNPTNCQVEAVESTVVSTLGTSASLASPFQVEGCSGLAFKPTFTAKTTGKTSKANGASLATTINQPAGQANIKSVLVTLPKQLPSRLSTLNKACPEATFAANPYSCPAGSFVGTARANTPVLPAKMVGPAIFVSHGGEAFPDLDLVLEADGIRVIVVGNTKITKGITTTNFATTPDVPVSSITVNLPTASNSALAANGNLCVPTLVMPVVITGQNGKQVKQNTKIAVTGCGVQIVGHKLVGRTAYLTIKTFAAGRISSSGSGVGHTSRSLSGASNATTLKVSVSRGRPHKTKIRVGFLSKKKGVGNSSATVTVG
jgi:hypothetical protein